MKNKINIINMTTILWTKVKWIKLIFIMIIFLWLLFFFNEISFAEEMRDNISSEEMIINIQQKPSFIKRFWNNVCNTTYYIFIGESNDNIGEGPRGVLICCIAVSIILYTLEKIHPDN